MSHIGRIDPPGARPGRSLWRFFPWYVGAGMLFVMAVNGAMTWAAVQTFPGLATTRGFATSNGYDRVMAAAERQAALGWTVATALDGDRPVVTLAGPDGAPLPEARLAAAVQRPLGPPERSELAFRATAPGRFEAEAALPRGKWDLDLTVTAAGSDYHTVRRIVLK